MCLLLISVFGSAQASDTGPRLADLFGQPVWLDSSPAVFSFVDDTLVDRSAVARSEGSASTLRRYETGRKMYALGNLVVLAGVGVGVLGTGLGFVIVEATVNRVAFPVVGAVVVVSSIVVGTGLIYGGAILSTLGALRVTNAVRQGLGVEVSSLLVVVSFVAIGSALVGVPYLGVLAALGLNALQMRKIGRRLEGVGISDFQLGPSSGGFAFSGRF